MSRQFGLSNTSHRTFGKRPTVVLSRDDEAAIRENAVIGWLVLCGGVLAVGLGVLFAAALVLVG